jgi:hypothetical protein
LPDDVFIEHFLDLMGLGKLVSGALGAIFELLANDVVTKLYAFVADKHGRTGNELANFVLALPTERAVQQFSVVMSAAGVFCHRMSLLAHKCPSVIARRRPATQNDLERLSL